MLNISTIVAGIVFVTLAAANVVVMLEAFQPSRSATARTRLIAVHRVGGYEARSERTHSPRKEEFGDAWRRLNARN